MGGILSTRGPRTSLGAAVRALITALVLLLRAALSHADLVEGARIDRVVVEGSTVFDQDDFRPILAGWEGRRLHIEDVLAIVDAVTSLYRGQGYINSGAILPEQDVSDGELVIKIVEGGLTAIEVTQSGRIDPRWVKRRIEPVLTTPLNLLEVRDALTQLEREEAVSHVRGRLSPGEGRGHADLTLEVFEADNFVITLSGNNYRSPSTGSGQGQIDVRHQNLSGWGDSLRLGHAASRGANSTHVRYEFPVQRLNSRLSLHYSTGDAIVTEEPFDAIDIESETDIRGLEVLTDWAGQGDGRWTTMVGYEEKDATFRLLGLPFDFSPGSLNGRSQARVATLAVQYAYRGGDSGWAARIGLRRGLDRGDVTKLPSGNDAVFDLYTAQLRMINRFSLRDDGTTWTFRIDVDYQTTADVLPAFERFALGGHDTVRGHRENRVLKDSGVLVRAELTTPLGPHPGPGRATVDLLLFTDYGRGWNSSREANVERAVAIASLGVGLRAEKAGLGFDIAYATRLTAHARVGSKLQDNGIHLGVSYEF